MKLLLVAATASEADAIGTPAAGRMVVSGVGRTNAAAATTLGLIAHGPFDAVISVGLAGVLPGSGLEIGDVIAADHCVYMEEGIDTPEGFRTMSDLGWPLGAFEGNAVPCGGDLVDRLRSILPMGRIATVATCSGIDAAAERVAARTGCVAEAMEGAAVVHAAGRLDVPGIEIRAISNTTGDRDGQVWDVRLALQALADLMPAVLDRLG